MNTSRYLSSINNFKINVLHKNVFQLKIMRGIILKITRWRSYNFWYMKRYLHVKKRCSFIENRTVPKHVQWCHSKEKKFAWPGYQYLPHKFIFNWMFECKKLLVRIEQGAKTIFFMENGVKICTTLYREDELWKL